MNKIGILGSGWLGLALAEKAKKKGHQVWTTTTTKGKVDRLQNKGFHAQYLSFSETSMVGKIDFFNHIDINISSNHFSNWYIFYPIKIPG